MATTMEPLRCIGLKQAVLSDDGKAVLLELMMANGQLFPLELQSGGVELLSRVLLGSAEALGLAQAARADLAEIDLTLPVRVPVQALAVRPQAEGGPVLLARAGCIDLGIRLEDAAAARALAERLRVAAG